MMMGKDKGKMLAIMIGHPDDTQSEDGNPEDDGIEAAKSMASAMGSDLSDDDAKKFYQAFKMAKYACDAEEDQEESSQES